MSKANSVTPRGTSKEPNITTESGTWEAVYKFTDNHQENLDKYQELLMIYGNVSLGPVGGEEISLYNLKA